MNDLCCWIPCAVCLRGIPLMSASAPGKPGSFLLEVGLGLNVGRAGKAWAAALCVLSPVSLLWGVWSPGPSLPHPPQTPARPGAFKGVCFCLWACPSLAFVPWGSLSFQVVYGSFRAVTSSRFPECVWLGPALGSALIYFLTF